MPNKAIFLDRDGVINVDHGYVFRKEDFDFHDGIFDILKKLQDWGFLIIIITNQSGISRGFYTVDDFLKLDKWMRDVFKKNGVNITQTYYCPHHEDDKCSCRKPNPKMILEAMEKYNIDPKKSWMIGDKISDIEAGQRAGIKNNIHITSQKTLYAICDTIKPFIN